MVCICETCKKKFFPKRGSTARFCSPVCGKKFQRHEFRKKNPLPVLQGVCLRCQKPFVKTRPKKQYCSRACQRMAVYDRRKAENLKGRPERRCKFCDAVLPPESTLQRMFCSSACAQRFHRWGKKKAEKRACVACGEMFIPNRLNQKYCSNFCAGKEDPPPEPEKKKKLPSVGLREMEKAAREAGMSYGKYQAMLFMQSAARV